MKQLTAKEKIAKCLKDEGRPLTSTEIADLAFDGNRNFASTYLSQLRDSGLLTRQLNAKRMYEYSLNENVDTKAVKAIRSTPKTQPKAPEPSLTIDAAAYLQREAMKAYLRLYKANLTTEDATIEAMYNILKPGAL